MSHDEQQDVFFGVKGRERRIALIERNKAAAIKQGEKQRADSAEPDFNSSSDWSSSSSACTVVEAVPEMQPRRLEPEVDDADAAAEEGAEAYDASEEIPPPPSRSRPRFHEDPRLPAFLEQEEQERQRQMRQRTSSPIREEDNLVRESISRLTVVGRSVRRLVQPKIDTMKMCLKIQKELHE